MRIESKSPQERMDVVKERDDREIMVVQLLVGPSETLQIGRCQEPQDETLNVDWNGKAVSIAPAIHHSFAALGDSFYGRRMSDRIQVYVPVDRRVRRYSKTCHGTE